MSRIPLSALIAEVLKHDDSEQVRQLISELQLSHLSVRDFLFHLRRMKGRLVLLDIAKAFQLSLTPSVHELVRSQPPVSPAFVAAHAVSVNDATATEPARTKPPTSAIAQPVTSATSEALAEPAASKFAADSNHDTCECCVTRKAFDAARCGSGPPLVKRVPGTKRLSCLTCKKPIALIDFDSTASALSDTLSDSQRARLFAHCKVGHRPRRLFGAIVWQCGCCARHALDDLHSTHTEGNARDGFKKWCLEQRRCVSSQKGCDCAKKRTRRNATATADATADATAEGTMQLATSATAEVSGKAFAKAAEASSGGASAELTASIFPAASNVASVVSVTRRKRKLATLCEHGHHRRKCVVCRQRKRQSVTSSRLTVNRLLPPLNSHLSVLPLFATSSPVDVNYVDVDYVDVDYVDVDYVDGIQFRSEALPGAATGQ